MDERVVVEEFDCRRRIRRVLRPPADGNRRRETDKRANPLAARADRMAHRLGKRHRTRIGSRQNAVQRPFDKIQECFAVHYSKENLPGPIAPWL